MQTSNSADNADVSVERTAANRVAVRLLFALGVPLAAFEAIVVHSLMVGRPAVGAMLGLLATLVAGAVLLMTLVPPENRRRTLSQLSLFVSVVAVVSALALRNKLLTVTGDSASAATAIQTALFLVFQAGWAYTDWLTVGKGWTAQSRYVPAALGSVVLIAGGIFTLGGGDTPQPAETAGETYVALGASVPDGLREAARAGTDRGSDFAHYHAGGQPLLGIAFSTRDWMRRERVDDDLRGIFDRDADVQGAHVLLAKPGYAVAMVEVQAGDNVNAIRMEFGRVDGSLISYDGRYRSEWIGSYRPGEGTTQLDAMDEIIVGIAGTSSMVVNSLGVLVVKP